MAIQASNRRQHICCSLSSHIFVSPPTSQDHVGTNLYSLVNRKLLIIVMITYNLSRSYKPCIQTRNSMAWYIQRHCAVNSCAYSQSEIRPINVRHPLRMHDHPKIHQLFLDHIRVIQHLHVSGSYYRIYSFISQEILDIIRVSYWGSRLMIGSGWILGWNL